MRQPGYAPAVLAVLTLLAGCQRGEPAASPDAAIPVTITTVQPGSSARTLSAVGTVRYRRETPLGFTTPGKLARVTFEEGDAVARGQLLATLDPTLTSGDLSVASAEATRARAEYDRLKALFDQGWVTRPRFEAAKAALDAAEARVSQAGFASGTTRLTSPSAGVVLAKFVQPGQVVAAGTPALILGQADQGFVFRAPLVDADAASVSVGTPVEISLPALGNRPVAARVSQVDGRANEATGAFTVQVQLPSDPRLKSGMIGSARFALPPRPGGAIEVPPSAVTGLRGGEGVVYVIDPRTLRVHPRSVVIAEVGDHALTVASGLSPGEMLATSGVERLKPNARVRPVGPTR